MPIDPKKCCGMHSLEKEKSGECCQNEKQEDAEQETYEYSPKIHELAKAYPNKTYRELEKELNE